jgi:polyisoprenoid-binding protein YceI
MLAMECRARKNCWHVHLMFPSLRRLGPLLAGAWFLALPGTGNAADWAVNPDHLAVNFAVSHFDISYVHGRFEKIAATVQFDPDAKTGQVVVTIDANSIDTAHRTRDAVLRSDQFLDAGANPEIRFVSERFVFDGDRLTAVDGTLWLHGVQRPLRLTVERFACKDVAAGIVKHFTCGGEFRTTFKRSDFGMKRFVPDVGDEVKLDIDIEAARR